MGFSFFQQLQKRDRDFSVEIDGTAYPVQVSENTRAKRLTLRLLPGGDGLKVTAPPHIGDDELYQFVERNRNWAAARMSRLPEKRSLAPGNVIPFRGIDHRIMSSGKLRGTVEVGDEEGEKVLRVPGSEKDVPRKLLGWLKREARRELDHRVTFHTAELGVRAKRIRITDTSSRWGSCSTTRTLSFSWRIIMAPPEVLDYLAAHEVAHLVEMNHSKDFWTLTRRLCPQTDHGRAWLKQHGAKLHSVSV